MLSARPDGVTEALTAIPLLLRQEGWGQSEQAGNLRAQLVAYLDDPSPHRRLLAVRSLPVAYSDPAELAAAVAARIAVEHNATVLTQALAVLDGAVPRDLADPVLAAAARRKAGPSIAGLAAGDDAEDRDLLEWWVGAHLNCALWGATPHATATVRSWFSDPGAAGPLFRAALPMLRGYASFDTEDQIRDTILSLFRIAAAALSRELTSGPDNAPVTLAADTMTTELYHASGAFEHRTPRPTASQKARWLADFIGIIEDLTPVRHPHSCYQLLKTLEFFIDEAPVRVFHAMAAIIKDDSPFRFESMGADIAVRMLDRYLADYREALTADPQLLSELRQILDILTAVGWPSALHLSYSLGDVFR
jgi:hypothetical protein